MATIQILNAPRATRTIPKKREFKIDMRKVRMFGGLGALFLLFFLFLWWRGVFTPAETEEGQIRKLTQMFKERVSAHDWRGLTALCELTPQRADQWVKSVEIGPANAIAIDDVQMPPGFAVPVGATEFELGVTVFAHIQAGPISLADTRPRTGMVYYVKSGGRWRVDVERSAPAFGIPIPMK